MVVKAGPEQSHPRDTSRGQESFSSLRMVRAEALGAAGRGEAGKCVLQIVP